MEFGVPHTNLRDFMDQGWSYLSQQLEKVVSALMVAALPKHDVFQAIADPTRSRLLRLLADKEMPIASITEYFPISRTAVNKHLHVLSDAGLVSWV